MRLLNYRIKVKKMKNEGYMLSVPKLPGCITWAKTYDGAIEMGREAIKGFIVALHKAGQPVPVERRSWLGVLRGSPESITPYPNSA